MANSHARGGHESMIGVEHVDQLAAEDVELLAGSIADQSAQLAPRPRRRGCRSSDALLKLGRQELVACRGRRRVGLEGSLTVGKARLHCRPKENGRVGLSGGGGARTLR
eukprot:Mycagemm_TRINITY_DN10291_c0_g14::TRINITY_DN10291_c0_g14_i2::g.4308::m.4308 type:complete len:109 gc:universal TRINITY_DN10291_c0_g14_i2:154-480(+)